MTLTDTKRFATNLLAACEMIEEVGMPEAEIRNYDGVSFGWKDKNNSYIFMFFVYPDGRNNGWLRGERKGNKVKTLGKRTRAALIRAKVMLEGEK